MQEIAPVSDIINPKSKKNKYLIIGLIILAIISVIIYFVYYLFNYQFIFYLIDIHDQTKTEKVKYNEKAVINNSVVINEKNNSNIYIGLNSVSWKMNSKRVLELNDTLIYLNIVDPIQIKFNNTSFSLKKGFHGIYDSDKKQFIVFEGSVEYNNLSVKPDNYLDISTNTIKSFDRNIFKNDNSYKSLYELVKTYKALSEKLIDLESPIIENLSITDGYETVNEQIDITGKTELNVKIKINGEEVKQNDDGTFKITKSLKNKDNVFIIEVIDKSGNNFSKKITIIKKDSCEGITECGKCNNAPCPNASSNPSSSENTTISCSSSFSSEFLSLINTYRVEKGKNVLSLNPSMNQAACNHSTWMNNTGSLNHTGENGSQFYERCTASGTQCDAENIAQGSDNAQQVFEMWKNNSEHNENMLGDHTQLGVGSAGNYSTAVFY